MLIATTHGPMDEDLLEKRVHTIDNENEHTVALEYWLDDELVHRSVAVQLKASLGAVMEQALFA